MNQSKQKIMPWLCLAVLITVESAALLSWIKRDTRPAAWDESIHLNLALDYYQAVSDGNWRRALEPAYYNYPPLYHLTVALFYGQTAPGPDRLKNALAYTSVAYMALFLIIVYFIGAKTFSPVGGLLASLIVSGYPVIIFVSRRALVDLSLAVWVSAAYMCLIYSKNFSKPFWSSCFGTVCGLGLLAKWSFPVYVALPALTIGIYALVKKRYINLLLALGAKVLIATPWYINNWIPALTRIGRHSHGGTTEGDPGVATISNWLWYWWSLPDRIAVPTCFLLVVGVITLFITGPILKKRNNSNHWLVLAWFALPIVLFTLNPNKDVRYILPCLPAAALLSSGWLNPKNKTIAGLAILLSATVVTTWGWAYFGPDGRLSFNWLNHPFTIVEAEQPKKEDWKHEKIINFIYANHKGVPSPSPLGGEGRVRGQDERNFALVTVVANHPFLHSSTLNLSARVLNNKVKFKGYKRNLGELTDFILTKTGDLGPEFTLKKIKEGYEILTNQPQWFQDTFHQAANWPLPDGSEAILYQFNPTAGTHPKTMFSSIELSLKNITLPGFDANVTQFKTEIVPDTAGGTQPGRFKKIVISGDNVIYRGLEMEKFKLTLASPQISWPFFLGNGRLRLISLKEAGIQATLPMRSIEELLRKRAKWLQNPVIKAEETAAAGLNITASGRVFNKLPLKVKVAIMLNKNQLQIKLAYVKIGWLRVPVILLKGAVDKSFSLEPSSGLPFKLKINNLEIKDEKLVVS